MSPLFTLIYATHANGTHHKLALDALRSLDRADAENWRRVFLKHAEIYLEGSKAPDTEFKDFKNHVLHVRDNYWGGAPEKVQNWYNHTVDALRDGDWARAAYSAGVLSHYYTDPIHPFHTAQSEAENNIHRSAEWSINRSYDALRREADVRGTSPAVSMPPGDHWLKDMVCQGAETANAQYERLIAHYDIHKGVVDPPSGLDAIARSLTGDLIVYASKGFALILDRAIADSGATPPDVSLTLETVIASLKVPLKWVTKKIDDAATRRLVEAMYDELMATGRVETMLPDDDKMVRDLYAREVLEPRVRTVAAERAARLPVVRVETPSRPVSTTLPPPAAAASNGSKAASLSVSSSRVPRPAQYTPTVTDVLATPIASAKSGLSTLQRTSRNFLSATDDLEAAPSIGPKLAERFAAAGIKTVQDFLSTDVDAAALSLGERRITRETIVDWKDQARLVMTVPGLRGTHAQLLVGAGFRSADALAAADPATLSSQVLEFAITAEGARVLRSGDTPDFEVITRWIESARAALAA